MNSAINSLSQSIIPLSSSSSLPKNVGYLCLYYQNVRGLRTKTNELFLSVCNCEYDVIALSETWLLPSIFNSEIFNDDFVVYRSDRSPLNSNFSMGGGVLIAVRSCFSSSRLTVPDSDEIEIVAVKITDSNCKNIYVCCLYIPSGSGEDIYELYNNVLNKFFIVANSSIDDCILIVGDFNFSLVDWIPDDENVNVLLPVNVSAEIDSKVIFDLLSEDMCQINGIRNYQDRLLDLCFCNSGVEVIVKECLHPLSKVDVYHPPLELFINTKIIKTISTQLNDCTYNFKKSNFTALNEFLCSYEWNELFSTCIDVESKVTVFYDILFLGIEKFVPKFKNKGNCNNGHPPWFNRTLLKLKNLRSKAFKKYKKHFRYNDFLEYGFLRKRFLSCQAAAYKSYIKNTEKSFVSDPSKFWSFVNSKKKSGGIPSIVNYNGVTSSDVESTCNLFADFFKSVYVTESVDDNNDTTNSNLVSNIMECVNLGILQVSYDDVLSALKAIDAKKGAGPDNVHPLLLQKCAHSLATPLLELFNSSLSEGTFPDRWKKSTITPIFKSGSRSSVENYRGIAILATVGKLFEKLVCNLLFPQFRPFVSVFQHGFMKGRSTTTNLIEFTNHAVGVIESGHQLDVIYTDIRKAFDRLLHTKLLHKLNKMGVHSAMYNWVKSYLTNRRQCVKILGWSSFSYQVMSGVPQGSHLGPLLFVLFMNDVVSVFKTSRCLLFADDLKIFQTVRSIGDALSLQSDLDRLISWCDLNCLELHVKKCIVMSFHRKKSPLHFEYSIYNLRLDRVHEVRDLGVIFDTKVDFSCHIDLIISKAYSMMGFIMRICVDFHNPTALKCLFYAHIRSILEYCSVVWHPNHAVYIDKIESVQKKFLSFMFYKFGYYKYIQFAPYSFKRKVLGLESLSDRRKNACVFFIFDLFNGRIDASNILSLIDVNVPPRSIRNHVFLRVKFHRTQYGSFEPITNMSVIFNNVFSSYEFDLSRDIFRERIRSISFM